MEAVLVGIGTLMIAATCIPLVRADHWWVRVFDFPRLQITLILMLVLIAYLLVREGPSAADNVFLAALSLCLIYQCVRMYPYTPIARKQVQTSKQPSAENRISVLISNVHMPNRNALILRELVQELNPDIILAVETDDWWERELAAFERTHTYTVKQAQANTYGMLLYSRLPLRNPLVKFLVQEDVPSIHASVRLRTGREVELRCLHPRPPAPGESDRSTERDAELLIVGKALKELDQPALVLGDMNDVAWSRTNGLFQSISGLLDPRIGRGFFHTFNANWPLLRFPLDHVFSSRQFRLITFKRLRHCGSDHFPVFAELSWEPDAQFEHEKLHATPDEKQEAREKIELAQQLRTSRQSYPARLERRAR